MTVSELKKRSCGRVSRCMAQGYGVSCYLRDQMTDYLKRLLAVKSFELGQTVACRVTGMISRHGFTPVASSFENSKCKELYSYAGINFIHNHPPRDKPPGHDLKGAKTLPRNNHCVQNPSPRERAGSQKPHPRDIKLENFTNMSINSDII